MIRLADMKERQTRQDMADVIGGEHGCLTPTRLALIACSTLGPQHDDGYALLAGVVDDVSGPADATCGHRWHPQASPLCRTRRAAC